MISLFSRKKNAREDGEATRRQILETAVRLFAEHGYAETRARAKRLIESGAVSLDGKLIMDMLIEGLDPINTGFVLDTYWVQHGGGDVRYWIEKLAGRIDILHLKDMAKSDGNEPPQYITEVGNGNLYWEGIIETALRTGVKSFVVEQDTCPGDPFDSLRKSADYLRANFF